MKTGSIHDHPDNRGIWVEPWVIDLVDGDHASAMLLSQLLWWHQPAKNGRLKLKFERAGDHWLTRSDGDWWEECRLSLRQVRRIRKVLLAAGLIHHKVVRVDGATVSAWRPNLEAIQAADGGDDDPPEWRDRVTPGVAREGQSNGVTRSRHSHGTDAIASLPIPSENIERSTTNPLPAPNGAAAAGEVIVLADERKPVRPTPEQSSAARDIVRAWWDAQHPSPVSNFIGVAQIVARFLAAGYPLERVIHALNDASVPTRNSMLLELRKDRPSRNRPMAPAVVDQWRIYAATNIAPRFGGASDAG